MGAKRTAKRPKMRFPLAPGELSYGAFADLMRALDKAGIAPIGELAEPPEAAEGDDLARVVREHIHIMKVFGKLGERSLRLIDSDESERLHAKQPKELIKCARLVRVANARAYWQRVKTFMRPLIAQGLSTEQILDRAENEFAKSDRETLRRWGLTGLRKEMKSGLSHYL
jgi:hypothetical protein